MGRQYAPRRQGRLRVRVRLGTGRQSDRRVPLHGVTHVEHKNFAAFADASMLAGADRQQMRDLSRRMRAAWLAFVVHGDPNAAAGTGLPHWDRFTPDNPTVLHLASIPVADRATPAI